MAKKPYLRIVPVPGADSPAERGDVQGGGGAGADGPGGLGGPGGPEVTASRTLIEQAYTQLRDDIIEGRLAPGEKLRVEHLKARYGVGAGTLREAITRLSSDALVVAEGQRGFRVSPVALEELQDITSLRLQIELEALRRSIRQSDALWRAELTRTFQALCVYEQPIQPSDRKQWELLNARFHEVLIRPAATPWTLRVLRMLSRHSERYRRFTIGLHDPSRDVHAEHEQIYQAAVAGQEARAALALEAHIRATPDLLMRAWRDGRQVPGQGLPV